MEIRDPRFDPQPGDIVSRDYGDRRKTRIVIRRSGEKLVYVRDLSSETQHICWLENWRAWCAQPGVQVLEDPPVLAPETVAAT